MENTFKTAEEILSTNPNWSRHDPDVIEAMHIFGRQVAEAVRNECASKVHDYGVFGKADIEAINTIDIEQFIK